MTCCLYASLFPLRNTASILLLFAFASTTLKTDGLGTIDTFTGNPESVVGQKKLETHFPGGQGDPTQVVFSASKIDQMAAALKSAPGVTEITPQLAGLPIPGQPLPDVAEVNGNQVSLTLSATSAGVKVLGMAKAVVLK